MTPFFSAICVTFGRHKSLNEVVADFLAQDYKGQKELIICNTFPHQKLHVETPKYMEIMMINCDARPSSLGAARNKAIEAASGTHIVTWDDDDCFLPNHLSNFAKHFGDGDWVWLTPQFWGMGDTVKAIVPGACPTFSFTKKAWQELGGYPNLTVGEDRGLIGKITEKFQGKKVTLDNDDISFVYRWGQGNYHASGEGDDRPGLKPAHDRVAADLQRRVKAGLEPTGEIVLNPKRGVNWLALTKEYLESLRMQQAQKKSEVCVIELGRYGDIINILPILLHINNTFGKPQLMVSREFASLLDGVSYVEPCVVDLRNDQLTEAVVLATRKFRRVICTQIWGKDWEQVKDTPAYNMESWRAAGFLNKFDDGTWTPLFDRRDKEREEGVVKKCSGSDKPLLLVNVTAATSSPFAQGPKLLESIKAKWGTDFEIVDLGKLRLHRVYDMLGLMDEARALVSIDTLPLHIAAASNIPTVALVNPQSWLGTIPRCNCVARLTYDEANPDAVNAAIEKAVTAPLYTIYPPQVKTPPSYRNIFHCVERHEERNQREVGRKEFAQRSWDVLYSNHGVIPMHLWHYPRNAQNIGDKRELPYLKDVLKPALDLAADHDIIMWTNDDNFLHHELPEILRYHVGLYGVCVSQRCEFMNPIPAGKSPKFFSEASRQHMGRDLFACTKEWLLSKWDELPDFLLGASDFDLCLAAMVRVYFKLPFSRKNCELNLPPADLPRGYVAHQFHPPKWNASDNTDTAPSQVYNRALFKRWASDHLPSLWFNPGNMTI